LRHVSSADDFRRVIGNKSTAQTELPFLWRVDQDRCLEGIVDLALFDSAARRCLILDWKTDRVPPDDTKTLHGRYRPQLAAYWKAIGEITKMDVQAAIYSTAAGALVRYQAGELSDEWSQLLKSRPEELAAVIKPEKNPRAAQLQFENFA